MKSIYIRNRTQKFSLFTVSKRICKFICTIYFLINFEGDESICTPNIYIRKHGVFRIVQINDFYPNR